MLATGGLLGLLLMGAAVGGLVTGLDGDQDPSDDDKGNNGPEAANGGDSPLDVQETEAPPLADSEPTAAEDDPSDSLSQLVFDDKAGSDTAEPVAAPFDPVSGSDVADPSAPMAPPTSGPASPDTSSEPDHGNPGHRDIIDTIPFGDGPDIPLVTDFDAETDRLILDFEGAADEAPVIAVDLEISPGDAVVLANGVPVMFVAEEDALTASHIDLVMTGPPVRVGDGELGTATTALLDGGTVSDAAEARTALFEVLSGNGGGADAITGGVGSDLLTGTASGDAIFGNEGGDTLAGGDGNDELQGDSGDDLLDGGAATDFLEGGDGDDTISGGAGADLAFGGEGADLIEGGEGDDGLQGGRGADTLLGGAGDDVIDGTFSRGGRLSDEDAGDLIDGGDGEDTIRIGAGDTVTGGQDADIFLASADIAGAEDITLVTDFDPGEDVIEIDYDPVALPHPRVTVEDTEDGSGADVLVNGEVILRVQGAQGLDPALIQLRANGT